MKNKNQEIIEHAAEQWVNILFAHIKHKEITKKIKLQYKLQNKNEKTTKHILNR